MPDAVEAFVAQVIEPFRVNVAGASSPLDYMSYLSLAHGQRSGDEANVVDQVFTRALLEWLGWTTGDWRYNQPEVGHGKNPQRPDYRVISGGVTAFIVEDKSTSLDWDATYLEQMNKYALGTIGYALWCNARTVRLSRFLADGRVETLAVANVDAIYGPAPALMTAHDEAALAHVFAVLGKERFVDFEPLVNAVCTDDPRIDLATDDSLAEFISGSHAVLDEIGRGATVQIYAARAAIPALAERQRALATELVEANAQLVAQRWSTDQLPVVRSLVEHVAPRLGQISEEDLAVTAFTPGQLQAVHIGEWAKTVSKVDTEWRLLEWEDRTSRPVNDAYEIWRRMQPDQDEAKTKPEVFGEQVAYVLFVRLILVRLLEDKVILRERIASNGGFAAWRDLVESRFVSPGSVGLAEIYGSEFLTMLFKLVGSYYRHFFQQPVFDWYRPDDIVLVRLLAHLNRYDFSSITHDLLGFTYEHYVDRRDRAAKGQFLTRPGLVKFMLQEAGYGGPSIIGQRVLDHACGSGSFLIHAVREFRAQLADAMAQLSDGTIVAHDLLSGEHPKRTEFATQLLEYIARDFVGMDIDPFACYLAELNLLVQVLDEVTLLWTSGHEAPIDRFLIFNADGLTMPDHVLHATRAATTMGVESASLTDESWPLKSRESPFAHGFHFVVANPPYVTPKKHDVLSTARETPFFQEVIEQDTNLYLLFVRLAEYYLADDGVAVLVAPLGILGDDSGDKARRLMTTDRCRLEAITRFYSSTVLFAGVDQWVTVFRFAAGAKDRPAPPVHLRGGMTEEDASMEEVVVDGPLVVESAPPQDKRLLPDPWRSPWLHVADQRGFDVWQHVCEVGGGFLHQLLDRYVDIKQGDVNTSSVGPLRRKKPGKNSIPEFGGRASQPFAPLPEATAWVEVPINRPKSGAGTVVFDIAHARAPEQGFVLQVQANLHIARRLRGTWYERSPAQPAVFLHSLWRCAAKEGCERETKAILGLLSSGLFNYVFALWSTNFNVQSNTFRRIVIPDPSTFPHEPLAAAVDAALEARALVEARIRGTRGSYDGDEIALDLPAILQASGLPTISLHSAELSGQISRRDSKPTRKVGWLFERGHVTSSDEGFVAMLEELMKRDADARWADLAPAFLIPEAASRGAWSQLVAETRQEVSRAERSFASAMLELDSIVVDWYRLPGDLETVVSAGPPWSYKAARQRFRRLLGRAP